MNQVSEKRLDANGNEKPFSRRVNPGKVKQKPRLNFEKIIHKQNSL